MKTFKEAFNEILDAVIVYKQNKSDIHLESDYDIYENGYEHYEIFVWNGTGMDYSIYSHKTADYEISEIAGAIKLAGLRS